MFTAGYNLPGCLPDDSVHEFDSKESAREYLKMMITYHASLMMHDSVADVSMSMAIRDLNNGSDSVIYDGWVYWIAVVK